MKKTTGQIIDTIAAGREILTSKELLPAFGNMSNESESFYLDHISSYPNKSAGLPFSDFLRISRTNKKNRGRGARILYGWHQTSIGEILVAQTVNGVCYLGFELEGNKELTINRMHKWLPDADFTEDRNATKDYASETMRIWRFCEKASESNISNQLPLDLHGTDFQLSVWEALLQIPYGCTASYQEMASKINKPAAVRAVGNAIGSNPVSLLIPCHRVIQSNGKIENYGWGNNRKKILLFSELASQIF